MQGSEHKCRYDRIMDDITAGLSDEDMLEKYKQLDPRTLTVYRMVQKGLPWKPETNILTLWRLMTPREREINRQQVTARQNKKYSI